MFKKLTKWEVFAKYNYNSNDYIVMVRKNKKSGMMYFKTIKVAHTISSYLFKYDVIYKDVLFNEIN